MTTKRIGLAGTILAALILAGSSAVYSQTPAIPKAAPGIAGAIDLQVTVVERQVIAAAEAMPADKYGFTPESLDIGGANFKGVYTFGGLVKHVAATNYLLWSGAVGEPPPANVKNTQGPAELKSKAEIVQFLKDSFALGHRAARTLTPENAGDELRGIRGSTQPRLFVVTFLLTHAFDEYGQMEEYLRLNGIVPPASAGN